MPTLRKWTLRVRVESTTPPRPKASSSLLLPSQLRGFLISTLSPSNPPPPLSSIEARKLCLDKYVQPSKVKNSTNPIQRCTLNLKSSSTSWLEQSIPEALSKRKLMTPLLRPSNPL